MTLNKGIYVIGASGHAKVIIAAIRAGGSVCSGVFDDDEKFYGKNIMGIPVLGKVSDIPDKDSTKAVIAIGQNYIRKKVKEMFTHVLWQTVIHPHTWIDSTVKIAEGSVVFAGAVIQPDTTVGAHSIINTSASVDHDCIIGSYCHIAPGAHLAGGVVVGDNVFMGIGSVSVQYIDICEGVTLGAGAVVVKSINTPGTYIGAPARRVACPSLKSRGFDFA